jgi:SIR2-like domain
MNILLLGAGFSRNWGGWLASEVFDYLLGCPEFTACPPLRRALWRSKDQGGFEQTLAVLQSDASFSPAERAAAAQPFEAALIRTFSDMNAGLLGLTDLEFPTSFPWKVGHFLAGFDAIFTLNQDLLLEHRYMPHITGPGQQVSAWRGAQLPGLTVLPGSETATSEGWAARTWTDSGRTLLDDSLQPIYKLHGSTNWRTVDGKHVLVFGSSKVQVIESNRLLRSYIEIFQQALRRTDARLMVIGYGFGDTHINELIERGAEAGLRMFVIDPFGSDLAREHNKTRKNRQVIAETQAERIFEICLVGSSRRTLREIFLGDLVETGKLKRFLSLV